MKLVTIYNIAVKDFCIIHIFLHINKKYVLNLPEKDFLIYFRE